MRQTVIDFHTNRQLMQTDELNHNIRQPDFTIYVSLIAINNYIHQKLVNLTMSHNCSEQMEKIAKDTVNSVVDAIMHRRNVSGAGKSYSEIIEQIISNLMAFNVKDEMAFDVVHSTELAVAQAIVESCPMFDNEEFEPNKTYRTIDSKSIAVEMYLKR